jgi:putative endonuclease
MAGHNDLGRLGEKIAVNHLLANSYSILETNWRCGRLEVDIIARLAGELIVAEVKTRKEGFLRSPVESVNKRKQAAMIKAANAYLYRTGLDLDVRFDIISVIFSAGNKVQVSHLENAFFPSVRN